MGRFNPNRVVNQARLYSEVIYDVVKSSISTGYPTDRKLASFFRKNKKFGSSDRRFVSETVFSLFRWWGWLRKFARSESVLWNIKDYNVATNQSWLRILLAANLLDRDALHPIAAQWKNSLKDFRTFSKYLETLGERIIEEKAAGISAIFKVQTLTERDLVPIWFSDECYIPKENLSLLINMFQKRPPIWIRGQCKNIVALCDELKKEGLTARRSDFLADAILIDQPKKNLFELESFKSGKFEIQDFASQVIGYVCHANAGQRWWDICAGAGGKSLQLASMMKAKGVVVSTDIRQWKLDDLKRRLRRGRFSNISIREWHGKGVPGRPANFDGVLVDAPCSCSGTWRRNPDARWTMTHDDVKSFPKIQLEILNKAAKGVKKNGVLVYATCSIFDRENESIIQEFIASRDDFRLDSFSHPISKKTVTGMLRIWPEEANSDAVFVCKMIRV